MLQRCYQQINKGFLFIQTSWDYEHAWKILWLRIRVSLKSDEFVTLFPLWLNVTDKFFMNEADCLTRKSLFVISTLLTTLKSWTVRTFSFEFHSSTFTQPLSNYGGEIYLLYLQAVKGNCWATFMFTSFYLIARYWRRWMILA